VTTRQRLAAILLWSAVILVGTIFGASVYQRTSLIPEWGGDLPQSVILHFRGTNAGRAIDRFWTGFTGPTSIAVILALVLNWHAGARRRWISLGAILFFVLLAWTLLYFVPKGVIPLMLRGGEGLAPDGITQMARAWIFWDWLRMAGTLASYLCLLKAATLRYDDGKPTNSASATRGS
jgi:hypothetical protein